MMILVNPYDGKYDDKELLILERSSIPTGNIMVQYILILERSLKVRKNIMVGKIRKILNSYMKYYGGYPTDRHPLA